MSFGDRLRRRREELNISRAELAESLGVSRSAIGNYETGVSFPKEDVMLRLFDCLKVDPNYLYRDSFHGEEQVLSHRERMMLEQYRSLPSIGKETVRSVVDALCAYRDEVGQEVPQREVQIPLYHSMAAVGYAAPVLGDDFEYTPLHSDTPPDAEFAVRIEGESMAPWLSNGTISYVNRDPLVVGDVGLFCVSGTILCRQYYRDTNGGISLFTLNRSYAEEDLLLHRQAARSVVCLGRVMMHTLPLPGRKGAVEE